MRRLPARPGLPSATAERLAAEQAKIDAAADAKGAAEARWPVVRRADWFRTEVVSVLQEVAGRGERCMYCSSGESNAVEHFRPRAAYPERTFEWENYLWACGVCNGNKGDHFQLLPTGAPSIINPLDDDVWKHLQIDDIGQYVGTFDEQGIEDPRGYNSYKRLKLNRKALLEQRRDRMRELREWTDDLLAQLDARAISKEEAARRIDQWASSGIQPDVADYFLKGPGREVEPFRSLFRVLNGIPE